MISKSLVDKLLATISQHLDCSAHDDHWMREIEFEDLLERDARMIYEHCGLLTLISLWENLPGLPFYISEKNYFDIKRRYVRKHFKADAPESDAKALAVKLNVSVKFIYDAVASTDEKDDRQQDLL